MRKSVTRTSKNRIVNLWNELPENVINAPSTRCFEARLDKFWIKYGIKYDFDRCIQFETQKQAGLGTAKMVDVNEEIDLGTQAI